MTPVCVAIELNLNPHPLHTTETQKMGQPAAEMGDNYVVMTNLDGLLFKWIRRANERRDDLDLPIGFIEDSIALLNRVLGAEYLERLLITDSEPVHFLDDEANPLRKWLLSATVDTHIVQTLELAGYFRAFQDDASLPDKVEKLKRDSFWPILFELAIATRAKRASRAPQKVCLNREIPSSIGDFTISAAGYDIPCECSRLGHSPQITEPRALEECLSHRISDGTKRIAVALCVKVRSTVALTGDTYNRVLQLVRRGLADARRSKLPAEYSDGSTTVTFEELGHTSEQMPFQLVDGRVTNVLGTDWDSAMRLSRVPARDFAEVEDRFDQGERFHEYEAVRLFLKFGRPVSQLDYYSRLTAKLKKKLKQTKISAQHFGKVVLVEVPFDLRTVDTGKLREAVREAAVHSRMTLAIILANREPNLHLRYHYSQSTTFNQTAAVLQPEVLELFNRIAQSEGTVDPILGSPYRRSWAEAQMHAAKIAKTSSE
jgi:hypothetical protein